jgi:hypothetical protein
MTLVTVVESHSVCQALEELQVPALLEVCWAPGFLGLWVVNLLVVLEVAVGDHPKTVVFPRAWAKLLETPWEEDFLAAYVLYILHPDRVLTAH